jgi:D-alanyl-D-alanine endopeptidase (penicillin-binding protein 7)
MAHELAHVQRLDYIGRWLATILRDVMFWNPFVLHWYSRLIEEQEAASDECAAELLGDPVAVASGLVEVSAHAVRLPVVSVGPLRASQMARESDRLARRVDRLEESAILRHGRTQWPRALAYVVLVAFLMLQPHMALPLADLPALAGRAFRVSAAAAHWPI